MSSYLAINILIVLIPLILSFEKNVRFYRKLRNVLYSIFIVGIIFITWDVKATKTGDWSFNPEYTGSIEMFGLPLEEILFFVTVPYSIIFIYESLSFYLKERSYSFDKKYFLLLCAIFLTAGFINSDKNYTAAILIFCSMIFLFSYFCDHKVYSSKISILTILISFIPFLIVNYILTSLPVVEYNPEAIIGVRITTIPAEDFFYSFAMISCWLIVYSLLKRNELNLKLKAVDQSKS